MHLDRLLQLDARPQILDQVGSDAAEQQGDGGGRMAAAASGARDSMDRESAVRFWSVGFRNLLAHLLPMGDLFVDAGSLCVLAAFMLRRQVGLIPFLFMC